MTAFIQDSTLSVTSVLGCTKQSSCQSFKLCQVFQTIYSLLCVNLQSFIFFREDHELMDHILHHLPHTNLLQNHFLIGQVNYLHFIHSLSDYCPHQAYNLQQLDLNLLVLHHFPLQRNRHSFNFSVFFSPSLFT